MATSNNDMDKNSFKLDCFLFNHMPNPLQTVQEGCPTSFKTSDYLACNSTPKPPKAQKFLKKMVWGKYMVGRSHRKSSEIHIWSKIHIWIISFVKSKSLKQLRGCVLEAAFSYIFVGFLYLQIFFKIVWMKVMMGICMRFLLGMRVLILVMVYIS